MPIRHFALAALLVACGSSASETDGADVTDNALSATNATVLASAPLAAHHSAASSHGLYFVTDGENVVHRFVAGEPDHIVVRPAGTTITALAASEAGIAWTESDGKMYAAAPDGTNRRALVGLDLGRPADSVLGVATQLAKALLAFEARLFDPETRMLTMNATHVFAIDAKSNVRQFALDAVEVPPTLVTLNDDPVFTSGSCTPWQLVADADAVYVLELCTDHARIERIGIQDSKRTTIDDSPPHGAFVGDIVLDGDSIAYTAMEASAEDPTTGDFTPTFEIRRASKAGGQVQVVAKNANGFFGLAAMGDRYYFSSPDLDDAATAHIASIPKAGGAPVDHATLKPTLGRTDVGVGSGDFASPGSVMTDGQSIFAIAREGDPEKPNAMQHVLLVKK